MKWWSNKFFSNKGVDLMLIFIGCTPFIYWVIRNIHLDLWYDEVYALENFILVPWDQTFLNYPLPNNHIFYCAVMQILSRLFHLRDIMILTDFVYVFRIVQILITVLIAVFSIKILKRHFNVNYYFLFLIILFTCIPFLNFSMQLRGYNLSALLFLLLIYYSWAYLEKPMTHYLYLVVFSSFALIYTIPSNIYFLIPFVITIVFSGLFKSGIETTVQTIKWRHKYVLLFIGVGFMLALIAYAPVIKQVIFNRYSSRPAPFPFFSFVLFFKIISGFLSNRYLLLIFLFIGLFGLNKFNLNNNKIIQFFILLILPFVLSFIHQKEPYDRVFIILMPVFCILTTVILGKLINGLFSKRLYIVTTCLLLEIYCLVVFRNELIKNEQVATINMLENNAREQSIYTSYFLEKFFHPDLTCRSLKGLITNDPIVLFEQEDPVAMSLYLRKNKIPFLAIETFEDLLNYIGKATHSKVYILSSYLKKNKSLLEHQEDLIVSVINQEPSFANILQCVKR